MKQTERENRGVFSAGTVSRLYLLAAILTLVLTVKTCSASAAAWMDAAAARLEESRAVQSVFALADKMQSGEGIPVFSQSAREERVEEH